MKGFIELIVHKDRLLLAVGTILSVSDRGPIGCTLTLTSDLIHNSATLGHVLHLPDSYNEVLAKLEAAQ